MARLNWAEGLQAAGRGLELIATRQVRREEAEADTLRAENFERLRHRLATERDALNATQAEDAQSRLFAQQDRAQAERERAADERHAGTLQAAEDREDYRTARAADMAERSAQRQRLEDAQRVLERAIADEAEHVGALEELGEPIEGVNNVGIARRTRLLQETRRRRALAERDVARYSKRGVRAPPRRPQSSAFAPEAEQDPFRRGAPLLIPTPAR